MIPLIALGSGIFALLAAFGLIAYINKQPSGNERMKEIAKAIQTGASAYLKRQYKTILIITVILAAILSLLLDWHTGITFVLGAVSSLIAGFVGMWVSVRANLKTAEAARRGNLGKAFVIALRGGAVMGLMLVGLSLIAISSLYIIFGNPEYIVGFGFGASLAALFAQLGGGIYTKAADVGADLVGKVEKGIPEDDPRNPAVIADLVGDNVGDCAGRGADLFESFSDNIIGAMILGLAMGSHWVLFPLFAGIVSVFSTVISLLLIRVKKKLNPVKALNLSVGIVAAINIALFYYLTTTFLGDIRYFYASVVGLATSILIVLITQYYTGDHKPVKTIAKASKTGAATNILTGFAVGLESTALPVIVMAASILISYLLGGIYGIATATLGILSTTAIIMALDTYGPITDNAGGIAEMSKLPKETREITDKLDAIGNTTKAITKGYAMGCAALSAFVLFFAYLQITGLNVIDVAKPIVFVGAFIGVMLPFLFSAFAIKAVGKAAFEIVEEVRRQFREIKGLLRGKAKPDYASCVDISTKSALREMIIPSLLGVITPIVVGVLLGKEAVGALIIGGTVGGITLAMLMNTGGAAWDNAKKYIEAGNFGGKGSPAHKAAVIGDTVGDPFKDTAGPSLHILVKLLNMVSIIFAPIFIGLLLSM
ncbi:MAG: sodium-translocating pyrophosphatase [Candidatus Aenigmarchaeota archaeon]|nr:sodium-translocating pyrophosphatase [Candidatus Aenigmarchaeota archaeon]